MQKGDAVAQDVLDRFYTVVAKAMVPVLYMYDPEVIVVRGGLHGLPALYEEVPKRWSKYALGAKLKTRFLPGAGAEL